MTTEALSQTQAPADLAPSDPAHAARNGLVINLLLVSAFVVNLNETIMNVAIPSIRDAFQVTPSDAQWLATAFLLTMAVVIPVTGFLLQRLSTRAVYILAMSLFSTGTALAIFAPNLGLLIACRVIQASGTAVMMPLLMTTVMTLVAPQKATSHRLDAEIQAAEARPVPGRPAPASKQPPVHAADIFRLTKAMPDSNDVPGVLDDLSQLAQASSTTLQSVSPSTVSPLTGGYGALPLNVVVAGPFPAVSRFLQRLRQQVALGKNGALQVDGRLLVVNNVQLATTDGSSVTATLSLDAFVYGVAPPPATTTTTTAGG